MKLIATIKNYGSDVKSNPYNVEVRLDGRLIWVKSFRTVKRSEAEIEKQFGGAEICKDFIYKKENLALLKQYE